MQTWKKVFYKIKYTLHKCIHWEYWPQEFVYFPMYPIYAYYGLKVRAGFFLSVNHYDKSMPNTMTESKMKTYQFIPTQYYPTTIYIEPKQDFNFILNAIQQADISYPLIVKPDIGYKGIGVKKILNETELHHHLSTIKKPYLIQRLMDYPHEIGLFWVRFPNETKGKLTGIVYKEYLHIIGDGKQTLEELIYSEARTYYQLHYLSTKFKDKWNSIIEKDEKIILVPFGSHFRGSKFIDYSHKITPKLIETFNEICLQINGYNFGRMDIKFDNWNNLENGKNISIIETNGGGSEPTHIYDPKHSIIFAWKEITKHIIYLGRIAELNKQNGHKIPSLRDVLRMWNEYGKHMKEVE